MSRRQCAMQACNGAGCCNGADRCIGQCQGQCGAARATHRRNWAHAAPYAFSSVLCYHATSLRAFALLHTPSDSPQGAAKPIRDGDQCSAYSDHAGAVQRINKWPGATPALLNLHRQQEYFPDTTALCSAGTRFTFECQSADHIAAHISCAGMPCNNQGPKMRRQQPLSTQTPCLPEPNTQPITQEVWLASATQSSFNFHPGRLSEAKCHSWLNEYLAKAPLPVRPAPEVILV